MRKLLVCALAITACLIVVNLVENPLEYLTSFDGSELLERNGEQDGSFSAELDRKFEEAYNRGRADEATSINIEVPSRNIVREEAYNIKKAQKSAELTKQELLTEDEAKNDMGGLLRIEAVNSRFAHKIQGLLGSIQNKLDNAGQAENIFKPETPNADEFGSDGAVSDAIRHGPPPRQARARSRTVGVESPSAVDIFRQLAKLASPCETRVTSSCPAEHSAAHRPSLIRPS